MTTRSRTVSLLLAIALAFGVATLTAAPASAAGEQLERCTTWQQVTEMQNRTQWVRVSERACIQWINYGNQVRAVGQLRLDWPAPCTFGDCDFKALKASLMSFDELRIGVDWNFNGQTGTFDAPYVKGPYRWDGGDIILDTPTSWQPHPLGTYSAKAWMVVDLDNDGHGATQFDPTTEISVPFSAVG